MGEKVKASAIYAEAFRLEGEVKRLQEALAAARRECEEAFENGRAAGLEEAARDHLDGILTAEDEHLNFKRREFRRHAYQRFYARGRRDAALAAPGDGEEGKR